MTNDNVFAAWLQDALKELTDESHKTLARICEGYRVTREEVTACKKDMEGYIDDDCPLQPRELLRILYNGLDESAKEWYDATDKSPY